MKAKTHQHDITLESSKIENTLKLFESLGRVCSSSSQLNGECVGPKPAPATSEQFKIETRNTCQREGLVDRRVYNNDFRCFALQWAAKPGSFHLRIMNSFAVGALIIKLLLKYHNRTLIDGSQIVESIVQWFDCDTHVAVTPNEHLGLISRIQVV